MVTLRSIGKFLEPALAIKPGSFVHCESEGYIGVILEIDKISRSRQKLHPESKEVNDPQCYVMADERCFSDDTNCVMKVNASKLRPFKSDIPLKNKWTFAFLHKFRDGRYNIKDIDLNTNLLK